MSERIKYQHLIKLDKIPTLRIVGDQSQYHTEWDEIIIRDQTVDEYFSGFAKLFLTTAPGFKDSSEEAHFFYQIAEALPAPLKECFFVLGENYTSATVRIDKLNEFINFLEKYIAVNDHKGWERDNLNRYLIGLRQDKTGLEEAAQTQIGQKYFDHAMNVVKLIWPVFVDKHQECTQEGLEDIIRREYIHEILHYVTIQNELRGNEFHIRCVEPIISNLYFDKTLNSFGSLNKKEGISIQEQKQIIRLFKLTRLIAAGNEANSIIHEVLGQMVIKDTTNYSHYNFCYRLLQVVDSYLSIDSESSNLRIINSLSTDIDMDLLSYHLHTGGTLMILFANELKIEDLAQGFSFEYATGKDTDTILAQILDKSEMAVANPEVAKELIINAYDFIKKLNFELIKQFNEEFVTYIDQYPAAISNLDEATKQDALLLKSYREYRTFLDSL